MLENLKGNKKTVGIKQTLKAVEKNNAQVVYIAKDADERVVRNLLELCKKNSVEIVYVDTMKQLGKACGIEVGASAAALLKE
ncbi:MAG TPA: 50S ribosomal protein L7ae-like protein [Clostridiaceae bacterium]|nr:50S ribosomal protein L7ae-like protein [Clostridiaceae bacterium]